MKNHAFLFVPMGLLALGLSGCINQEVKRPPANPNDAFVERFSGQELERGSKIAVIVRGERPSGTIAAFMNAELKDADFTVKVLNPTDSLPPSISAKITAERKYSFSEAVIKSLSTSGDADPHSKLGITEDVLKGLAWGNDAHEDDVRVNDFSRYIDDFNVLIKKLDIDYVMTVLEGNPYSYYVEVINPKTSTLVGVYYLSANRDGWDKRMHGLKNIPGRTISEIVNDSENPRYVEMQYCNYLVGLLSGRRSHSAEG